MLGLDVAGFLSTLALGLTVVTTVVNVALAMDEDETFYAELARRDRPGNRRHGIVTQGRALARKLPSKKG